LIYNCRKSIFFWKNERQKREYIMKKFFLGFIISVFVLMIFGFNKRTDFFQTNKIIPPDQVKGMKAENMDDTYLNYFQSVLETKGKLKIAVMGSSVTKGTGSSSPKMSWPSRLKTFLQERNELKYRDIQLVNYGFSGFKAEDLLKEGKADQLILEKPDFIILETCIINNYRQSSTLFETIKYIDDLVNKIKKELPGAKILIISPNPILSSNKNQVGLTYEDYQMQTAAYFQQEGLNYMNIYDEMNKLLSQNNHKLQDYLADEIHPNDQGYQVWFEILLKHLF